MSKTDPNGRHTCRRSRHGAALLYTPPASVAAFALALAFAGSACGGGDDGAQPDAGPGIDAATADAGTDAAAADAATDASPDASVVTRGFFMATAGIQASVEGRFFDHHVELSTIASDSDVIEIHEEFLGIPWDEFEAGDQPPAVWVEAIDALADAAKATGKPVFLNVLPGRDFLSKRAAVVDGQLVVEENWSARCFDFAAAADGPAKKAAYLRYVEFMVERFEPRWMNVAIEINLFHLSCPEAWDGMVDVQRSAYDAVKAARPETIVFPSFALGPLYGFDCPEDMRAQCYDANYAAIAGLKRDRFAVSTYPYLQEFGVATVPDDWFTRAADRAGETVIISETGWNSAPAVARLDTECLQGVTGSVADQIAYLDRLVAEGEKANVEMFVWWSNSDLLPAFVMDDCPCDVDADWCAAVDVFRSSGGSDPAAQFSSELLLKIWGTMGLRDHAGDPKSAIYERWDDVRGSLLPPSAQP